MNGLSPCHLPAGEGQAVSVKNRHNRGEGDLTAYRSRLPSFAKFAFVFLIVFSLVSCQATETASPVAGTGSTPTVIPTFASTSAISGDVILLSMEENGYAHLFLYSAQGQPLLRLTADNANDLAPSLSPDGKLLAFASDRNGAFDIFTLTIASGEIRQITNTPTYDFAPSWSPDSQWLTYESYDGNDLEIAVHSLTDPAQPVSFLTNDEFSDTSPAWSPQGRQIAFVSNRAGNPDVWLADLDRVDAGRYTNLSNSPLAAEHNPRWDGARLLWTSEDHSLGFSGAYLWDAGVPDHPARWIADASLAAWDPTRTRLATVLRGPNVDYLSASSLDGGLLLPPVPLPGFVRSLLWLTIDLPTIPEPYRAASATVPASLWTAATSGQSAGGRWNLIPLPEVQAPYPQLHDLVDESFTALRARVITETGWDALASLQNAFVPLTSPLDPGLGDDWLYTGRAFAINTLISNAGWMVAVREEVGRQTYWRVYLRVQNPGGSHGQPLRESPWDLNARYNLDPQSYELGGTYSPVLSGYWLDFTALARAYGWERLPALPTWRNYYAGARFSEFALTGGLDWYSAMLQLYPPEALVTPTPRLPPTATATLTPRPTLTAGPSPTITLTPVSTTTPLPTDTLTPIPSNTPLP